MSAFFQVWDRFANLFTVSIKYLATAFSFAGQNRWALAIMAVTIIVRTLLLPIAIKQIKSMRDTQRLAPEMTRLRQKYKNDRQKMTEEVMELYRREGVNPDDTSTFVSTPQGVGNAAAHRKPEHGFR